jgi:hypothetical protein
MPNWVNNEIIIKGPKATLEAIKERGKSWLRVPKNKPIAEVLREINKFYSEDYIQKQIKEFEGATTREDGDDILYRTSEMDDFSFENFVPADVNDPKYQNAKDAACQGDYRNPNFNWYDWNIDNWGCKWDASDSSVEWEGNDLVIKFNTPWGTPEKFLENFAKMYPDVTLECFYFEEQGQFAKQKFWGDAKSDCIWTWVLDDDKKESIAKDFLLDLETNLDDIFQVVDLKKFIDEACFEVEFVVSVREYENASGSIYEDDPEQIVELLNNSSKDGEWSYDEDEDTYNFTKAE